MRLHRNLAIAIVKTLGQIFNEGIYADKAVERTLKSNKRWGSRDRAFIAETIYDIVRWKRLYAEAAEADTTLGEEELFKLLYVWVVLKDIEIPPWEEFEKLSAKVIRDRIRELNKIRKFRESVPDWLDDLGVQSLGEDLWTAELRALNEAASVVLRTNTIKTNREELLSDLKEENIETNPLEEYPQALALERRTNVLMSRAFRKGYFELQDASSQKVAHFTQVTPGMCVIDACAGAGGKSLHLSCIMQNRGQIIAMDIHGKKLKELNRRARRNGISIIETRLIRSKESVTKLYGLADCVLLDAPCSGLGVLRRNPDDKWKLNNDFINRCSRTQRKILNDFAGTVKPGGKLVYATCSILPQENSEQVKWFLNSEKGQDFLLESEEQIWASKSGYDGFYMARLRRSN